MSLVIYWNCRRTADSLRDLRRLSRFRYRRMRQTSAGKKKQNEDSPHRIGATEVRRAPRPKRALSRHKCRALLLAGKCRRSRNNGRFEPQRPVTALLVFVIPPLAFGGD